MLFNHQYEKALNNSLGHRTFVISHRCQCWAAREVLGCRGCSTIRIDCGRPFKTRLHPIRATYQQSSSSYLRGRYLLEHHATLAITSIIKGTSTNTEIPIIIHYGLEPLIGGYTVDDGFRMDFRRVRPDYPTNRVEILDIYTSISGGGSIVKDAAEDNLWFLRKGIRGHEFLPYGQELESDDFGITDPEDLQQLSLAGYFKMYLNPHPENALRSYAVEHPELARRIQRWLDHVAVMTNWEAIKRIEDPTTKAARMADYLRTNTTPAGADELSRPLREEMAKLGAVAVPELIKVIQAGITNGKDLDLPVLILYDIGKSAQSAVPLLCELLVKPGATEKKFICSALKTAADAKAIPFVRPILKLDDMMTVVEAAQALEAMGDKESFDSIAALLPKLKPQPNSMGSMDISYMRDLLRVLYQMDRQAADPIIKHYLADPAWAKDAEFLNPEY
jgi:hypothetical protein